MIVGIRPAPAAKRTGGCRGAHLIALLASTVLHAGIVAGLAYGVIDGDAIPPEPVVVELMSGVGTAPAGDSAAGGQQDLATGAGEVLPDAAERPPIEAQESVQRAPTESTKEPGPPLSRPRTVVKKPRVEPGRLRHAPQQPTVVEPADPAAATSPAPVAELTMPTEDAEPPSGNSLHQGDPLVASLGAGGAARAASGGSGRPNGRSGSGAEDKGSTRGPGFSLGGAANPMPSYPPAARRRGIEGKVVLDVLVSAEGRALSVEIARSSGSSLLDEAARETVGRWRFRPAMREEEAIEARATVPVHFSLIEP